MTSSPTKSAQSALILALCSLLEQRDSDSESHILRVQNYVRTLAGALSTQPLFAATLTPHYIDNLVSMVPLYDMGSAGIPDRVLLKPGRLTLEETVVMRAHTQIGYTAIAHAQKQFAISSPLLELAKEITLSHHERWNGSGYPNGLSGTDIPLAARLMAIADVYDALISSKVYKAGVSHHDAVHTIFSERAAHFDPDMVDTFIEIQDSFAAIAQRYADTEADMQHKINYMANAIAESAT